MYEMEEYESIIKKLYKQGQLSKLHDLCKSLYYNEFVSEKIRMTYGQCLIMALDNEKASYVFEKLYDEHYINYCVNSCLMYICFENLDFESTLFYLNELKKCCNKTQLRELVPFEIYLYNALGLDLNNICRTKSAYYLNSQIKEYSKDKAMDFMNYKNFYNPNGFDDEFNMDWLFTLSLEHVCISDRGLQFNPFDSHMCFFDKYYMDISNLYLQKNDSNDVFYSMPYSFDKDDSSDIPHRYAEISTLPFSNNICMITPTNSDKSVKKLVL